MVIQCLSYTYTNFNRFNVPKNLKTFYVKQNN